MMNNHSRTGIIACFIIAFFLQSCASLTPAPKDPAAALNSRVTALMDAKVNKDLNKVYTFFTSDYKKQVTEKVFTNPSKKRTETLSYAIDKINIEPSGEKAVVSVTSTIRMNGYTFKGAKDTQQWILDKNIWSLSAKPSVNTMAP